MTDEEAAAAEASLNSHPVPTPRPDHAAVPAPLPSPPDGSPQWLPEVLASMPMTSGGTPEETRLARYYNADHVLSKIQGALSNQAGTADALTRAIVTATVEGERTRAKWQASSECGWLGAELLAMMALLLIGAGIVLTHPKWLAFVVSNPLIVITWAGALGGASMALYGYTHGFLYKDILPSFWWWNVAKPVFGAVTGLVAAGLLLVGLLSVGTGHAGHSLLLLSVVAFAAGLKEQWFFAWIGQLKPGPPSGGTSSASVSPSPPR
jgi:hypothetical protein